MQSEVWPNHFVNLQWMIVKLGRLPLVNVTFITAFQQCFIKGLSVLLLTGKLLWKKVWAGFKHLMSRIPINTKVQCGFKPAAAHPRCSTFAECWVNRGKATITSTQGGLCSLAHAVNVDTSFKISDCYLIVHAALHFSGKAVCQVQVCNIGWHTGSAIDYIK